MEYYHLKAKIILRKIVKAKNLMHGKTSKIKHNKKGLLKNIQNNFEASRYHSLIVDRKSFPTNLIITAEIAQVADKIYYGEPRYAVKIFSRKKE